MTTMQKVIKYLALCLAFLIIISMMLLVIKVGYGVLSLFGTNNKNNNNINFIFICSIFLITTCSYDEICKQFHRTNYFTFYTNIAKLEYFCLLK